MIVNNDFVLKNHFAGINTRIEDNHFWESKQLGSSSPGVLLFTLVYFIYKNFNLKVMLEQINYEHTLRDFIVDHRIEVMSC
jgi:hypothetical protein